MLTKIPALMYQICYQLFVYLILFKFKQKPTFFHLALRMGLIILHNKVRYIVKKIKNFPQTRLILPNL